MQLGIATLLNYHSGQGHPLVLVPEEHTVQWPPYVCPPTRRPVLDGGRRGPSEALDQSRQQPRSPKRAAPAKGAAVTVLFNTERSLRVYFLRSADHAERRKSAKEMLDRASI